MADGERRVFELECGNGSFAKVMRAHGYTVTAIDPSISGIELAKSSFPEIAFHNASAYDDLSQRFGNFNAVVSLEVVEHVFYPRQYARAIYDLTAPGGHAVISTPYHSYLKNLALALSGKMDSHFTALCEYGHIKFWSMRTLSALLAEPGFQQIRFRRVGRIPPLAKSMIAIARRP
jgi:2-polyprenyl-6-hydroxyphenyl methylase/3-demethylubiquinone-9 3-methyltransferase